MTKTAAVFGTGKKVTRKNTHNDRQPANGFGADPKRQGAGKANWGRPGDELVQAILDEYDPAYDSADELYERAFGVSAPANFDWTTVADMSNEDHCAMNEIEEAMEAEWLKQHQVEQAEVEDEGEAFFASEAVRRQIIGRFSN